MQDSSLEAMAKFLWARGGCWVLSEPWAEKMRSHQDQGIKGQEEDFRGTL